MNLPEFDFRTLAMTLALVVPVEYTAIALSSFVSKIVVVNFLRDLGTSTRSRETKAECATVEKHVHARYKQSFLWPLEIWKVIRGNR